jgi:hypothetical protein
MFAVRRNWYRSFTPKDTWGRFQSCIFISSA